MVDSCRLAVGTVLVTAALAAGCGGAKPAGTVPTLAPGAASSNLRPKGMSDGAPSAPTPGQPAAGKPAGPQSAQPIDAP